MDVRISPVQWPLLIDALAFYRSRGFKEISLPWHAPRDINMITCPKQEYLTPLEDDFLVGSAEQSFLALLRHGQLNAGQYVALTPCFRREPVYDLLHQPYFMKVELFVAGVSTSEKAFELASLAKHFMERHVDDRVHVVTTPEGYDLELNNVEVGSYNPREFENMVWTCGTGLAEPRFSIAANNKND